MGQAHQSSMEKFHRTAGQHCEHALHWTPTHSRDRITSLNCQGRYVLPDGDLMEV